MRPLYFVLCLFIIACNSKDSAPKVVEAEARSIHRPYVHFTPDSMWMNDPNGMFYLDGTYHLFYQYYPDSTVWGPMHWGHATTTDLLNWERKPIAIYPDSLGYIFSGSAVVDIDNTSGFGTADNPPIVAFFTYHDPVLEKQGGEKFQTQALAYSTDKGETWVKYADNPVIENPGIKDFRDPKVVWHAPSKQWVLTLAAYDKAMFYVSKNLKDWSLVSEFGIEGDDRLWECPDLFPMEVDGEEKWILIVSIQKKAPNGGTATSYFVGDFDGTTFKADKDNQQWLDYGTDNYAFVTWDNAPDNRRIGIGWMSNWLYGQKVPTKKWRSAMTIPLELSLEKLDGSYRLKALPMVDGLDAMEPAYVADKQELKYDTVLYKDEGGLAPIYADFSFKRTGEGIIEIRFSNDSDFVSLGYNGDSDEYFIDRSAAGIGDFSEEFAEYHTAPAYTKGENITFSALLDASSVELFAGDGFTNMTDIVFPNSPYTKIEVKTYSESLFLEKLMVKKIKQ